MLPQLQHAEKIVARAFAVLHGRSHSCRGAEADHHVLVTMESPPLQFDAVFSSLLCLVV